MEPDKNIEAKFLKFMNDVLPPEDMKNINDSFIKAAANNILDSFAQKYADHTMLFNSMILYKNVVYFYFITL